MKILTQTDILDLNKHIKESNLTQSGVLGSTEHIELYLNNGQIVQIPNNLMEFFEMPNPTYDPILYGKNGLERIVGAECDGEQLYLFIQNGEKVQTVLVPNRLWVCASKNYDFKFTRLSGDRYYKYIRYYKDLEKWKETNKFKHQYDLFKSYCPIESNFISRGFTFFKNLQLKDVSVLSFDIETSGVVKDNTSDVYLISNTFRVGDKIEKRLFNFKDYSTRKEMLEDWCHWVRSKDPSLMIGHNIYMYDFPYLKHVADLNDCSLNLGRDNSSITISSWPSKFRKDGNEQIEYFKTKVWGREIVDTFFLSFKYDVGRKYESNGLKQIIKQEGLEKEGRTFVDAGKIRFYKDDPEMWSKVCEYASDDSDDSLKLFDLMAPAFFYSTQLIPKKFEDIINGASGSQLNSMMVRAYLQDGKSVAKASEALKYQGAISLGVPGIYRNVLKVDAVQLYPNVLISNNLYDVSKDPENMMTYCLKEFMKKRKYYKELYKQNGLEQYDAMQNTFKIFSNSVYGFLGAPGLNYNSPKIAAKITEYGREYLKTAIKWATSNDFSRYSEYIKNEVVVPNGDSENA